MRHGKREAPHSCKAVIVMTALVLILCCAAGGTLAWLAASTEAVTNTFTATQVDTEITEKTEGNAKTEITVKNTGDIPAYVRVTLVSYMTDESGNPTATTVTCNPTLNNDWFMGSDGYYYYKKSVPVNGSTSNLLGENLTMENGQVIEVLSQAIQAEGMSGNQNAVETVWPVTVGTDGTLCAK